MKKYYEVTYKYILEEELEVPGKKGTTVTKVKLKKKTERCLVSAEDISDAEVVANKEIPNNCDVPEFSITKISESNILWVA